MCPLTGRSSAASPASSGPGRGGGIHRDHLAGLAGPRPGSRELRDALGVAYRLRWIDFCADYVVPGRRGFSDCCQVPRTRDQPDRPANREQNGCNRATRGGAPDRHPAINGHGSGRHAIPGGCGGTPRQPVTPAARVLHPGAWARQGLPEPKCQAAYLLAGLDPRKCDTVTGSGCIDGPVTPPALPVPAPVSTAAALTGTCTVGYELVPGSAATGVFIAGPPPAGDVSGNGGVPDPALAYQVTLTNGSAATADVTGFAVAFYAAGSETGSDQESASGFITQGQSLTWTVIEDHTIHGYGDDPNQQLAQTAAIPAGADSCQFVAWS